MGDRDGYPGRGLSGWRERAGSVQRNFWAWSAIKQRLLRGPDEALDQPPEVP
jgi:hypothetical protein